MTPGPDRRRRHIVIGVAAVAVAAGLAWLLPVILGLRVRRPQDPFPHRPDGFVTDLARSEEAADAAAKDIKATLVKGLARRDRGLAASGLTPDFRACFPGPGDGTAVPDGQFALRRYAEASGPALDGAAFLSVLEAHSADWISVDRTTWRMFEFLLHTDSRWAYAGLHFQLAGPKPDGGRVDLQAVLEAELALTDGKWRLRKLRLLEGARIESDHAPFRDITQESGFQLAASEENRKLQQQIIDDRAVRMVGGLTCLDWNRDGFPDFIATVPSRQTTLFVNDGHGGFGQEPLPVQAPEESGYFFLYADLDGDGQEELVNSLVHDYAGGRARITIYTRKDGLWSSLPGALEFNVPEGTRDLMVQAIAPCDVDRDGDLDLFFGVYSTSASGGDSFNALGSCDGADNLLFINQGGLKFTEESDPRGLKGTQYTYIGTFFDFDGDGDPDLFEGDDWGPNHLWLNQGDGTFVEAAGHIFGRDSAYTMGATIADFDNTGAWSMYISNMYSHAGNRIVPLAAGLSEATRQAAAIVARGNMLYERGAANGEWSETAVERRVSWADWAWGCVFADLDNDGDRDLYVVNGYSSNSDAGAPDW